MTKYLVETFYTCTFKITHKLDELNEKKFSELDKRNDGQFEIIDVKLNNRKTKTINKNDFKKPIAKPSINNISEISSSVSDKINDLELQKSDLFLLCSNSYLQNQKSIIGNSEIYLSVAQSRIANVWANKVCLVAHSENKRCSLVLKHLDNCILASNPKSLAKWIIKLKNNSRLKHKIANNGYKTFKDKCQFKNYAQLLEKHLKIFV